MKSHRLLFVSLISTLACKYHIANEKLNCVGHSLRFHKYVSKTPFWYNNPQHSNFKSTILNTEIHNEIANTIKAQ